MISLKKFLQEKGYTRVPLKRTPTDHFEIKAEINGVQGRFILDTGASSTCVGFDSIEHFKLNPESSEVKAAGAGGRGMETQIARKNEISIGKWKKKNIAIILFNMTHVNSALLEYESIPVNGIIGADVLKKSKAIIDYDKHCIYLR
ncbi:acid protease [Leptobacterium flavescens]|uniref:Acid protease n=1 Tax=Leptobacterium flavescens TaxID=472055 RepID=A0A6P0UJL7_9FLAO|nr:retropepsin-like aspartic protease [Leptobacterium flavescens]NER12742.1 acid protease [Leptobacterium flavescens]